MNFILLRKACDRKASEINAGLLVQFFPPDKMMTYLALGLTCVGRLPYLILFISPLPIASYIQISK